MIQYRCPACGRAMESADALTGLTVICLGCMHPVPVPPPSAADPAPPPGASAPAAQPPSGASAPATAAPAERVPSGATAAPRVPGRLSCLSLVVGVVASVLLASAGLVVLLSLSTR
jgi:hypothetical protein